MQREDDVKTQGKLLQGRPEATGNQEGGLEQQGPSPLTP